MCLKKVRYGEKTVTFYPSCQSFLLTSFPKRSAAIAVSKIPKAATRRGDSGDASAISAATANTIVASAPVMRMTNPRELMRKSWPHVAQLWPTTQRNANRSQNGGRVPHAGHLIVISSRRRLYQGPSISNSSRAVHGLGSAETTR